MNALMWFVFGLDGGMLMALVIDRLWRRKPIVLTHFSESQRSELRTLCREMIAQWMEDASVDEGEKPQARVGDLVGTGGPGLLVKLEAVGDQAEPTCDAHGASETSGSVTPAALAKKGIK